MTAQATQTKIEAKKQPKTQKRYSFSSESVTEGHPDKVADQISDAILDSILAQDPMGRVACETLVTTGMALVAGEITTKCYVDIPKVVRETIREIGYDNPAIGFDYETCSVLTSIDEQSKDIALGVDRAGAGDQGLMFGYAVRETPELMPLPIQLAHALTRSLARARRSGAFPELRPDGKSQVTVDYDELVDAPGHDSLERLSAVAGRLKNLASELELPLMLISQLRKPPTPEERRNPSLARLYGSGAKSKHASFVIYVDRQWVRELKGSETAATLVVLKHRDGRVGKTDCTFDIGSLKFKA